MFIRRLLISMVLFAACASVTKGGAVVQARVNTGGGWFTYAFNVNTIPSYTIDVDHVISSLGLPAGTVWIRVYNITTTDAMGELVISASTQHRIVNVIVADSASFFSDSILSPAAGDFGGIRRSGNLTLHTQVSVSGDLTGSILADQVYRVDVGGEIQERIENQDNFQQHLKVFTIRAGSVADGALIRAFRGEIDLIRIFDGDCHGDIRVDDRWIGTIDVLNGSIGSPSNTVSIKIKGTNPNNFDTSIDFIEADDVYANIESGDTGDPYVNIGEFHARGDVGGTLKVNLWNFVGPVIDGDLIGTIDKQLPFGKPLSIGGSLASTGRVLIEADGLTNQIYINRNNDGGEWESGGKIIVGSTELEEQYTATAASIGGGAAGLAPFTHHGSSCDPEDGDFIFITGIDRFDPELECIDYPFTQAKVRLYGPVELIGAAPHVEVLVHVGNDDYVDAGFTIETSIVASTGEREVLIKRENDDPWPEGEYRIVPLEGKMTSMGVEGDPDVDMFWYEFTLAGGCLEMLLQNFDFNEDESVCEADFLTWSSDPCDLNGDEAVDCDDITLLLNAVDLYQILTAE